MLDESLPESSKAEELSEIASILAQDKRLNLEVVVFVENDREAARKRAFQFKRMISDINRDVENQVKLSWFDVPETITKRDTEKGVELSEGLLIFSRLLTETEKEVSI